ncbi:hypothetical protein U0070_011620 [Myodes glareolus]|uniref:Uncharacterized protein n=1 Tax=Myodes glareolus TaxID=447135 RepID=A0AAW0HIQ7_MYOGA
MSTSSPRTLAAPSPWFTRSKQPSGTSGSHDFWWADCQPLTEASYINLPIPSLFSCCVDVAIPCNKRAHSVVLMWWLMDLEVLHMHGTISHEYHGRLCLISISAGMLKKSRRKNKQS